MNRHRWCDCAEFPMTVPVTFRYWLRGNGERKIAPRIPPRIAAQSLRPREVCEQFVGMGKANQLADLANALVLVN
jgi:hypothetical protein